MTQVATISNLAENKPGGKHLLWALLGGLLTLGGLIGAWFFWRLWGQNAPRQAYWAAVICGTAGASASALAIAALGSHQRQCGRAPVKILLKLCRRLMLALQIVCSLIAAVSAAMLVFEFKMPH